MDGTILNKKYNIVDRIKALEEGGGGGGYVLPVASESTLGGVKVGDNLTIDENGVLSASCGAGLDYSTTEQNTGKKWIDGKPVYQKTVAFDTSTGNEASIDLTDCAIERLIDVHFHLGVQQNLQIAGGIGYYNGNSDYINGYYNMTEKKFHFRYGAYWMSATNYMTILYTKTTVETKKRSKSKQ